MTTPRSTSRLRWTIGLLAAVVIPFLVFGAQQGQCSDAGVGGESACSSGPLVGWPGAWLVTAACVVLFLGSLRQLARFDHGRR